MQTIELRASSEKMLKLIQTLKTENINRKKSEDALMEAQKISHIGSWELDLIKKEIWASKESFRIYGIDQDSEYIPLEKAQARVLRQYRRGLNDTLKNLIEFDKPYDVEFRIKKANTGEVIYVHSKAILQKDEMGNPTKILGVLHDVNDQVLARIELESTKKRLENVIKATNVGIWEWDILKDEFYSNERLASMIGYTIDDLPTKNIDRYALIHPEDLQKTKSKMNDVFNRATDYYSVEYRMKHKNGNWIWILDTGNVTSWSLDYLPLVMTGTHMDITESKTKQLQIEYLSNHDYLTGLHNRMYFESKLMELDIEENYPLTLVMADVNGLKIVNDSLGHLKGDELLKKAASILKQVSRENDIVARLGGDEFILVFPKTTLEESKEKVKFLHNLASFEKEGPITLSISYGLAEKSNKDDST